MRLIKMITSPIQTSLDLVVQGVPRWEQTVPLQLHVVKVALVESQRRRNYKCNFNNSNEINRPLPLSPLVLPPLLHRLDQDQTASIPFARRETSPATTPLLKPLPSPVLFTNLHLAGPSLLPNLVPLLSPTSPSKRSQKATSPKSTSGLLCFLPTAKTFKSTSIESILPSLKLSPVPSILRDLLLLSLPKVPSPSPLFKLQCSSLCELTESKIERTPSI